MREADGKLGCWRTRPWTNISSRMCDITAMKFASPGVELWGRNCRFEGSPPIRGGTLPGFSSTVSWNREAVASEYRYVDRRRYLEAILPLALLHTLTTDTYTRNLVDCHQVCRPEYF